MRPLLAGDLVSIVAPSGPIPEERFARGLAVLHARGLRTRLHRPASTFRYLAGTDEARLDGLLQAFTDPESRCVWAGRGGYGATRLLPSLDLPALVRAGLPLVGFSDVTALHLALASNGGRSVHGPVITSLGDVPEAAVDRVLAMLAAPATPPAPLLGEVLVPGTAEGRLLGGCLSLVTSLVGTRFLPSLRGAILFLEDVEERPYRLDRMWTQLRTAGALDGLAGIAFGEFCGCEDPSGAYTSRQVLTELAAELHVPVLAGLPFGHGRDNRALPHGARARIEGDRLVFLEGLASP